MSKNKTITIDGHAYDILKSIKKDLEDQNQTADLSDSIRELNKRGKHND